MGKNLKNILCRHCYDLFPYNRIGIRCHAETCSQVPDDRGREAPRYLDPRAYGLWSRQGLELGPQTPCPICKHQGRLVPACPRCRRDLDATLGEGTDHVIGVIGATEAGKTHFLATVLHQFLNTQIGGDEWKVEFADRRDRRLFRSDFLTPLFDQQQELPATPATVGTELRLLLVNQRTAQKVLLVFRDLGGEIFSDADQLKTVKFLQYASGVVLITDPLAFEPSMSADIQSWEINGKPTAVDVLKTFQDVLESCEHPPEHDIFPFLPEEKTLAVALTKADLILPDDHRFWADNGDAPYLVPGFWENRRDVSQETQEWIGTHLGSDLSMEASNFADVGYFFVSSFGYRHTPGSTLEKTPQPLRVHEPIFALLDRLTQRASDGSDKFGLGKSGTGRSTGHHHDEDDLL